MKKGIYDSPNENSHFVRMIEKSNLQLMLVIIKLAK